jgi:hypothetical protein
MKIRLDVARWVVQCCASERRCVRIISPLRSCRNGPAGQRFACQKRQLPVGAFDVIWCDQPRMIAGVLPDYAPALKTSGAVSMRM